tara:strand:+ start:9988 stop:10677 length:690 start_codon:yes stop_codon:yes gene_type:complete
MNKKTTVEIILLILIITSIIVPIVYLSRDNTLLDTVGYDKVEDKGKNTNEYYYRYLFETYKFLKANFIICIVSLIFFTVLLIVKLSGIKVDKILNFIITIIIMLFLMLFTGLAFGFLFYLGQEEFYLDTVNYTSRSKSIYLDNELNKFLNKIKDNKKDIKFNKIELTKINDLLGKNILLDENNKLENEIKSLEEQVDKLEYLINLYYILINSSFFSAGFLALLILTKLY